ncbi:MAG: ASCH domain-containing protein [Treponema sp.]|nr:ASCH domain-containing protein [Treponema sp.]
MQALVLPAIYTIPDKHKTSDFLFWNIGCKYSMIFIMKTLSIRQPFASLICRGIKTIENRSWDTAYRGKLLIHASGKPLAWPTFDFLPRDFVKCYQKYYGTSIRNMPKEYASFAKWIEELSNFYHLEKITFHQPVDIKERVKKYGYALPVQTIIGEVELVEIVINSKELFAIPNNYHWVMANPILYEKPILNVMGKLKLWEYEL